MAYEIYVISNSELFKEGLNAIATFCESDGFQALAWMSAVISVVITSVSYIKSQDIMVFLKWIIGYVFVFSVLLGSPSTVSIINTSDTTVPAQIVDNVPLGVALPAHLITAIGHGITTDLETVFALPDSVSYTKTGMLFGSNLFQLSLNSKTDDPGIMNRMNLYIKNCVVGDILISHKYTFTDLLNSTDVWGLISGNPSLIRGMFNNGVFQTCSEAVKSLNTSISNYASNGALSILSKLIPSNHSYANTAVANMLTNSYQFFKVNSSNASDILKQNIAINAVRDGIKNYALETGSVAGMENIANTMAMTNTRMSWATSRHIGVETLPLMQTVILLMLICFFPIMVTLCILPNIGFNIFKNYIYSLIWLESWPIMFSILNMAMNFYLSSGSIHTVTLSSINLLAQEHSDISGISGYLILAIPFLTLGIVKGMAFTFNNAAQYLGGMMHSIAQSSATSAVMGNYSFGNISTDNATANMLSANKHDSNFTSMHGMSTQQLGNAATVMTTSMGHHVYQTAPGMSQLAVSTGVAQTTASTLSHQSEAALSSAFQHSTQYSEALSHNALEGNNSTIGFNSQVDHAMNTLKSISHSVAQKESIDNKAAFQQMSQTSISGQVRGEESLGFKFIGNGATVGASAEIRGLGQSTSTHDGSYQSGSDRSISDSDIQNFNSALNVVKNYASTHTTSNQNSTAENAAIQMGADLNRSERLSKSAQFINTHSDAINSNFNQAFANYVGKNYPTEANQILSATGDSPLLQKQQELANQFIQTHAQQLANTYGNNASNFQKQGAPNSKYMTNNYQRESDGMMSHTQGLGVNQSSSNAMQKTVRNNIADNMGTVMASTEKENVSGLNKNVDMEMKSGKKYAESSITSHGLDSIKDLV